MSSRPKWVLPLRVVGTGASVAVKCLCVRVCVCGGRVVRLWVCGHVRARAVRSPGTGTGPRESQSWSDDTDKGEIKRTQNTRV